MELTREQAIRLSREGLWTWLAETGAEFKEDWPEWDKYGYILGRCFLCECVGYDSENAKINCFECPYYQKYGYCIQDDSPYNKWDHSKTIEDKMMYAGLFLKQLNTLE
jgi:hypothetical protein